MSDSTSSASAPLSQEDRRNSLSYQTPPPQPDTAPLEEGPGRKFVHPPSTGGSSRSLEPTQQRHSQGTPATVVSVHSPPPKVSSTTSQEAPLFALVTPIAANLSPTTTGPARSMPTTILEPMQAQSLTAGPAAPKRVKKKPPPLMTSASSPQLGGAMTSAGSSSVFGALTNANASTPNQLLPSLGSSSLSSTTLNPRVHLTAETLTVAHFCVNSTGCVSNPNPLLMNASITSDGHRYIPPTTPFPDKTPPLRSSNRAEPVSPLVYSVDEFRANSERLSPTPAGQGNASFAAVLGTSPDAHFGLKSEFMLPASVAPVGTPPNTASGLQPTSPAGGSSAFTATMASSPPLASSLLGQTAPSPSSAVSGGGGGPSSQGLGPAVPVGSPPTSSTFGVSGLRQQHRDPGSATSRISDFHDYPRSVTGASGTHSGGPSPKTIGLNVMVGSPSGPGMLGGGTSGPRLHTLHGVDGARTQLHFQDLIIKERIGKGSVGNVFRACHAVTGKLFAVKQLDLHQLHQHQNVPYERLPEKYKQLHQIVYRELQILHCHYRSPHLLKTYDAFYNGNSLTLSIVMEFMDYGTLEDIGRRFWRQNQKEAESRAKLQSNQNASTLASANVTSSTFQNDNASGFSSCGSGHPSSHPCHQPPQELMLPPPVPSTSDELSSNVSRTGAVEADGEETNRDSQRRDVHGSTPPPTQTSDCGDPHEDSVLTKAPGSDCGECAGGGGAAGSTNSSAISPSPSSPPQDQGYTNKPHRSPQFHFRHTNTSTSSMGASGSGHDRDPSHPPADLSPNSSAATRSVSTASAGGSSGGRVDRRLSAGGFSHASNDSPKISPHLVATLNRPDHLPPPAYLPPTSSSAAPTTSTAAATSAAITTPVGGASVQSFNINSASASQVASPKLGVGGVGGGAATALGESTKSATVSSFCVSALLQTGSSGASWGGAGPGSTTDISPIAASAASPTIHRRLPIPERAVCVLGEQVLLALKEMHDHHHMHRDIKPQNILVNKRGNVRLSDFGLAELSTPNHETPHEDGQGVGGAGGFGSEATDVRCSGTNRYMSPERQRGEAHGPPCDIWALGVTLAECAVGRYPYPIGDCAGPFEVMAIMSKPIEFTPEELDALTPRFIDFVNAATDPSPTKRPTASALLLHEVFAQWPGEYNLSEELSEALPNLTPLDNTSFGSVGATLSDRRNSGSSVQTLGLQGVTLDGTSTTQTTATGGSTTSGSVAFGGQLLMTSPRAGSNGNDTPSSRQNTPLWHMLQEGASEEQQKEAARARGWKKTTPNAAAVPSFGAPDVHRRSSGPRKQ